MQAAIGTAGEPLTPNPSPQGEGDRSRSATPLHTPDAVAQFLMRCLFTIFAEDVNLLPKNSFHDLLTSLRDTPERVQAVRSQLHEGRPLTAYELSRRFTGANTNTVTELLDTLVALGQARRLDDGRYAA